MKIFPSVQKMNSGLTCNWVDKILDLSILKAFEYKAQNLL